MLWKSRLQKRDFIHYLISTIGIYAERRDERLVSNRDYNRKYWQDRIDTLVATWADQVKDYQVRYYS